MRPSTGAASWAGHPFEGDKVKDFTGGVGERAEHLFEIAERLPIGEDRFQARGVVARAGIGRVVVEGERRPPPVGAPGIEEGVAGEGKDEGAKVGSVSARPVVRQQAGQRAGEAEPAFLKEIIGKGAIAGQPHQVPIEARAVGPVERGKRARRPVPKGLYVGGEQRSCVEWRRR